MAKVAASEPNVIPATVAANRWRRLRYFGWGKWLAKSPVAPAGWLIDLHVTRLAARSLRKGEGLGYW